MGTLLELERLLPKDHFRVTSSDIEREKAGSSILCGISNGQSSDISVLVLQAERKMGFYSTIFKLFRQIEASSGSKPSQAAYFM